MSDALKLFWSLTVAVYYLTVGILTIVVNLALFVVNLLAAGAYELANWAAGIGAGPVEPEPQEAPPSSKNPIQAHFESVTRADREDAA